MLACLVFPLVGHIAASFLVSLTTRVWVQSRTSSLLDNGPQRRESLGAPGDLMVLAQSYGTSVLSQKSTIFSRALDNCFPSQRQCEDRRCGCDMWGYVAK